MNHYTYFTSLPESPNVNALHSQQVDTFLPECTFVFEASNIIQSSFRTNRDEVGHVVFLSQCKFKNYKL